ncbi:maleylpyruvate isomerase family mycothiol-dependent enzyme [Paeniglutamicibacter sp. ABSL32-1]|nr:maleylpyruvate isomerase family mycothiol-dependent enzyme [Paeniglutamicibacter quisquiliarum]
MAGGILLPRNRRGTPPAFSSPGHGLLDSGPYAEIGESLTRNTARRQLWNAAHVERAVLAEDLATLEDSQWATPSLCGRWSVRETLAHLTAAASIGPARWFGSVLGARFDFDLHNDRRLAEHLGATPAQTLEGFNEIITSTTATFGPVEAWLGEVIIHSQDIRHPLGIAQRVGIEAATAVAGFLAKGDFTVPSKTNAAGLRLEATDGPFAIGDGPLVAGTTMALVMAMAGRGAYCDELTGPGVQALRARCLPPPGTGTQDRRA